jgi:hypothetical protein
MKRRNEHVIFLFFQLHSILPDNMRNIGLGTQEKALTAPRSFLTFSRTLSVPLQSLLRARALRCTLHARLSCEANERISLPCGCSGRAVPGDT